MENAALQRSIKTLRSQIAAERSRREAAEQEMELTLKENQGLEQSLALLDGCRARQKELEAEVEQLRLQWRADCANRWAWTRLRMSAVSLGYLIPQYFTFCLLVHQRQKARADAGA